MPRRICYVHIGPPKTGTSAIQWFLSENRSELLQKSYLVPLSGQSRGGGHHHLAHRLCGEEADPRHKASADNLAQELATTPSEAVIISTETLTNILSIPVLAKKFFARLDELGLEPRIVMFPRNQPQWLNSSYGQIAKSFRFRLTRKEFFSRMHYSKAAWLSKLELARSLDIPIIAKPYTSAISSGIAPEFLAAVGLDVVHDHQSGGKKVNESVGPFTIAVARAARSTINEDAIKFDQAARCERVLEAYLEKHELKDSGYCGLNTDTASRIEAECRSDNDTFSTAVWGRPWREVFADDVGLEFEPNDYDMIGVPSDAKRAFEKATRIMTKRVGIIMQRRKFASDGVWNDPRRYSHYNQVAAEHHKPQLSGVTSVPVDETCPVSSQTPEV